MKIYIHESETKPFLKRLFLEDQEEVVEDRGIARMEILSPKLKGNTLPSPFKNYVLGGDEYQADFFVSKMFSPILGWGSQNVLSIPIYGLMSHGLGVKINTGFGARYIQDSSFIEDFKFILEPSLVDLDYPSFVTLGYKRDGTVVFRKIGLPEGLIFNVVKGLKIRLSNYLYFDAVDERILEFWTISLKLSRFPYPLIEQTSSSFELKGEVQVLSLVLGEGVFRPNLFTTNKTLLGYVSSWGHNLGEASHRNERILGRLHGDSLQYRTDGYQTIIEVYRDIYSLLFG